jgi:nucleoporin NUP159
MRQPGVDPFTQSHRQSIASREAEERQLLADQDDGTQELLASELVPTLTLDEFVAHTDVVTAANETISSQVEAVYRDINAMIDTLGINARSLQCFIKGHMDGAGKPGQRTLDDLEAPEEWTLGDLPALAGMLHHDLTNDLNNGRVKDIGGKLDACKNLTRDLGRLRARKAELERIVAARVDPEQAGTTRSFPLTPEQSAQQNDLRREYARFTKNLAEAEEALTLLKTRIASINGARSGGPGATTMPTVDAVIRTINKMTSIAEKRSGDVDVLENQMRKMRLNSVARSREGTPSVGMTPQKRASIGPASSPLTPDASSTLRRNLRDSFAVSVSGAASPAAARKPQGLSRYTPEQKAQLLQRLNRRKDVLRKLEVHVVKEGVKTWVVDEPTMK